MVRDRGGGREHRDQLADRLHDARATGGDAAAPDLGVGIIIIIIIAFLRVSRLSRWCGGGVVVVCDGGRAQGGGVYAHGAIRSGERANNKREMVCRVPREPREARKRVGVVEKRKLLFSI